MFEIFMYKSINNGGGYKTGLCYCGVRISFLFYSQVSKEKCLLYGNLMQVKPPSLTSKDIPNGEGKEISHPKVFLVKFDPKN